MPWWSPKRPTTKRNHLSSSIEGCVFGVQTSLLHDRAALGALDGEVVQLIGRGLDVRLEAEALGEVLQPDAVVGVAADEAEVVVAQAEDGGVVDHAAGLVADRRVDDVADGQAAGVAGDRVLDERLGVGSEDLPLAQGGEVHDDGLLAAGPVLGDGALVVVAVGQPVPAVLHEALGQRARARMERRLLGQHGLCLRGDAVGDRHREAVLGGVDAHVDVGAAPSRSPGRCRPGTPTRRTPDRSSRATARSRRGATRARRSTGRCSRRRRCCRRS